MSKLEGILSLELTEELTAITLVTLKTRICLGKTVLSADNIHELKQMVHDAVNKIFNDSTVSVEDNNEVGTHKDNLFPFPGKDVNKLKKDVHITVDQVFDEFKENSQ